MGLAKQIKMAMLDKDILKKDIANALEMKPQSLYNSLNRDSLTVKKAEQIADLIGCDIVLKDRDTGKLY